RFKTPPKTSHMNERRRFLKLSVTAGGLILCGGGVAFALEPDRAAHFLPEERRMIEDYYRQGKKGQSQGAPAGFGQARRESPARAAKASGEKRPAPARFTKTAGASAARPGAGPAAATRLL